MVSKPEGFGIVYLEAMAAGCVTIGTEGEGIADIIIHEKNGFLIPADDPEELANCVERVMLEPVHAKLVAKAGTATAKEKTWVENAKTYIELFGY